MKIWTSAFVVIAVLALPGALVFAEAIRAAYIDAKNWLARRRRKKGFFRDSHGVLTTSSELRRWK